MRLTLILVIYIFASPLFAQLEIPSSFADLLDHTDMLFNQPVENQYKAQKVRDNELCEYQYAMKKKKGDLEIRYSIKPSAQQLEAIQNIPHIPTINLITTLASNDEDSVISYHVISQQSLSEDYKADWGLVAFFRPKEMFSDKKHCKMITLFAEGKATAHIFYLFDEVTEALEHQKFNLTFK